MLTLLVLACDPGCGGTTTRTTWTSGDVALTVDGVAVTSRR